jgi:hypothetical protein
MLFILQAHAHYTVVLVHALYIFVCALHISSWCSLYCWFMLFILLDGPCSFDYYSCSRHSRRGLVQEDKRTVFAYTHGLFIT